MAALLPCLALLAADWPGPSVALGSKSSVSNQSEYLVSGRKYGYFGDTQSIRARLHHNRLEVSNGPRKGRIGGSNVVVAAHEAMRLIEVSRLSIITLQPDSRAKSPLRT